MSRISLAYASLFTRDAAAVVEAAGEAGFEAAGIRITGRNPADTTYPNLVGDAAAIRRVRTAVKDRGLKLSNISTYHLSSEITLEDMKPVIATSAALGAEMIVINSTDPNPARRQAFIAEYAAEATSAGLRLGVEFVPFSQIKTLEQALELVATIDHPMFGMIIDSLHLGRSGGHPRDIAKVEAKRIFMAQLCDAPMPKPEGMDLPTEARTARLYPGAGALPLREFLLAMPAEVPIDCEIPSQSHINLPLAEQAKQVARVCRQFIAEARGGTPS
jgi:sugar phosphate isomerase/epimerase